MSLIGLRARNHPSQVLAHGAADDVDDRAIDLLHFTTISETYGPFTIDVAASADNAKCERYYDRATDGLAQSWAGERVWCNPPFSAIDPWVRKAWAEHSATLGIVMLLPATRTEQKWWQQLVEPRRDAPGSPLRVRFLPGRMRFLRPGEDVVAPGSRPPFGCCLLIWTGDA